MKNNVNIPIIGYIDTPFANKFAVPRQPILATSCKGVIHFYKPYNDKNAFLGLDGFSHIHVLFLFDKVDNNYFKSTVRPPRLGGNKKVGVFASRSPFRPSSIGLSILKLEKITYTKDDVKLLVSSIDLVDKTPIIDIKPYIPFVDSIKDAKGGYADTVPNTYDVVFSDKIDLHEFSDETILIIKEVLAQDPRPAYKSDDDNKIYEAILNGHNVYFRWLNSSIYVIDIR